MNARMLSLRSGVCQMDDHRDKVLLVLLRMYCSVALEEGMYFPK